jgi:hypothetical protein
MAPSDRFKINSSKIVHDTIDGEVIIINFDTGIYYSLNAVCKEVWSCLERNLIFGEILKELGTKYQGDPEDIKKETAQLLEDLEKEELIVLNNSGENKNLERENLVIEPNNGTEKPKFMKPVFRKYTDMKEMLLLDPIHEVDETGWPATKNPIKKKD